jgi:subtilisin family serine protease
MNFLSFRAWLRRCAPIRRPASCRTILALESLEDRLTLSTSPISAEAAYDQWRQTRFTIDDAKTSALPAVTTQASSATPTNASFGADIGLNQALASYPYRGTGYSVAVIDTGIDYNNPDLGGGWGKRVIAGYNFVNNTSNPMDDNGHGTNVAGIIGSSNATYSGVAPGVNFIALKVLDQNGSGTYGAVDDALQWVIAHQAQYNIVAVNLSLGSGDYTSNPYTFLESDFTTLEQDGLLIAVAAGNDYHGNPAGLAYPAVSPNVVSVGAVWAGNFGPADWASGAQDYSSTADQILSFSQRDANLSILAPGAMITSDYLGDKLQTMAGTSMATPVITGAAVLLRQALDAHGEAALTDQSHLLQLLQATGASIVDTGHGQDNVTHTGLTFKRVDIYAALGDLGTVPSAPALSPVANFVMASGSTRSIVLAGADADGDALTYTASLQSDGGLAYQLRQQLGLSYAGSYYLNAWGQNEKWLQGTGGSWYCVLPNGDLRRWTGTMSDTLQPANLLASLGATSYTDPSLLWNAAPAAALPVIIQIGGNVLFVNSPASYTGSFQIVATVSDGAQNASQTFTVSVVPPTPPQIDAIAAVSVTAGQSISVTLPGSDPDGDPLTYSAQILGSFASQPAVLSVSGDQLTLQANSGFSGVLTVQATVSDGDDTASTTFQVTVAPLSILSGNFSGNSTVTSVQFRPDGSWWATYSNGTTSQWAQWSPSANWSTVVAGDFNGDGKTDIAGFSNDGSWWIGISTGHSFVTSEWSQWLPAANWNKIMTGDFNGDGKTDVVGFSNDGSWWVGQATGSGFRTSEWTQWLPPVAWKMVSVGDFNGDGRTDIVGFNNEGAWWVGQSTGSRFATTQWAQWSAASNWNTVLTGDFNGDGRTDIVGFNGDGSWWDGLSNGSRFGTSEWAQWSPASTWAAVTVGDVNGDGKLDVIGRSTDGTWSVGYSTGTSFQTRAWTPGSSQAASVGAPNLDTLVSSDGDWAAWLGLSDAVLKHRAKPRTQPRHR